MKDMGFPTQKTLESQNEIFFLLMSEVYMISKNEAYSEALHFWGREG